MRRLEIYINGYLLDIDQETIFSLNLKANDVTDLSTRFVNYTSRISIPITDANRLTFGYSDVLNSASTVPYTAGVAKVNISGITVINGGVGILQGNTGNRFQLTILEPSKGFFDAIEGKYLRELNMSAFDALEDLDATCNTTSGIVSPLLDYGNTTFITSPPRFDINASTYLPSIYLSSVISAIFTDAGYSKSGAVFSEDEYLKMIIPFSKDAYEYSDEFATYYTAIAERTSATTPHLVLAGTDAGNIITTQTITQNDSGFYGNTTGYQASTSSPVETSIYDVLITVEINITVSGGAANVKLMRIGSGTLISLGITASTGTANYVGTYTLTVIEARQYIIVTEISSGTPTVTINSCKFTFAAQKTPRDWKFCSELLPNMLQKDLIKELAIHFGLIFSEQNGTIVCAMLEDIIQDRSGADNWTDKRVKVKDDIDFSPASFSQNNYFKYSNKDKVPVGIYQGNLPISSENATLQKTIYTSPFNASLTVQYATSGGVLINIITIPIYDTSTDRAAFDEPPGLRLAVVRDNVSGEVCVFNTEKTAFKVAYFHDPNRTRSMRPQYYLDTHYASLGQSLQQAKMVSRYYNITDADIAKFDFAKLVFDRDAYFLKQNLLNYISGEPSKVMMLKI